MKKLFFFLICILSYDFAFSYESFLEESIANDCKIYLFPEKIHITTHGITLKLSEQKELIIPILLTDEKGCYIPMKILSDLTNDYNQYVMCPYCHSFPVPFPSIYGGPCPNCHRTLYPRDFY